MNDLILAIQINTMNMARVLGISDAEAMKECSVRELLLYIGTVATSQQQPAPEPDDGGQAAFVAEATT